MYMLCICLQGVCVSNDLTLGSTEDTSKEASICVIYPLAFKDSLSVGNFTLSHNLIIIFSLT